MSTAGPSPPVEASHRMQAVPTRSVFDRIPSLFRFPDNRSSVSRDDTPGTLFADTDDGGVSHFHSSTSPPAPDARRTVELYAQIQSLEAEREVLRRQVEESSVVASRHVRQLAAALQEAELARDAAQIALVREKERCFLLQRRVALLESTAWQTAQPAAASREASARASSETRLSEFPRRAPPLVPDNDYVKASLRPATQPDVPEPISPRHGHHHHHHRQSDASRISFRLDRSFSACADTPVTPNPTISLFSQSLGGSDVSYPATRTEASAQMAVTPTVFWPHHTDRLTSALSATDRAEDSLRPPLPPPPCPSRATADRPRPRSQRFRSPLFSTPPSATAARRHD